jgi:cytochrome c5
MPPPARRRLYTAACQVCHAAGRRRRAEDRRQGRLGAAPRPGRDAWSASVVKGKGAMPPRGGSAATDAEIKTVVEWMVGQAK